MKGILIFIGAWLFFGSITAQTTRFIELSPEEIEVLFLEQNLELIAERMNVDMADAAITQAKLWPNPSLTVGDISFWSTKGQRDGADEVIPPMFGSFGRNM